MTFRAVKGAPGMWSKTSEQFRGRKDDQICHRKTETTREDAFDQVDIFEALFQPPDCFPLRLKAAKVYSLLAAEQGDVIVRHAELQGIAEEGDSVRRIRRDSLEPLENPVSFNREQRIGLAHVHEDA